MNRVLYICCLALALVMLSGVESVATAQYHKERGMVRDGNEQYKQRNYRRSLSHYNNAVEEDSTSYEALYNRANAYRQMVVSNPNSNEYTYATSNSYYEKIAADTLLSDSRRAEAYRNLGESLFAQQNYEAALNSFRESLKLNPNDKETKYDYVLAKRIVDQKRQAQQNQNQDQNQNNNNQNQDQNQDQSNQGDGGNDQQNNDNNDNNKDSDNKQDNNKDNSDSKSNEGDNKPKEGQDKGDDESEGENNKDGQNSENESESKPEPRELNADQRRMLDAIQAEEDKTQEKLKEGEKQVFVKGKKNW